MKTTVSNRNSGIVNAWQPNISPFWLVWWKISDTRNYWIPNTDKQHKTKAEAIKAAQEQGEFVDMGR